MFNLDQDSSRRVLECPDDAHSFCECFQMMKTNFKTASIDDLFRGPGNGNAGARRRHNHDVAIWTALEITNIAIVRQNLRPQLKVRGRFEDRTLWSLHDDGVDLAHFGGRKVNLHAHDALSVRR